MFDLIICLKHGLNILIPKYRFFDISMIYTLLFQAGPTVRHKCLQTLLRMIYYSSNDLLQDVLKSQPVSR